ncbi:MAG: hypothetical protein CL840_20530 [Crocinitomicaceae bacterium]|nr:hypothetical protein [Crocinitomicaceae bacterium]|tara:strand:- start:1201 stop:1902 length:702 start_codon:yes stop_codon:yes gene_type:complete
MTVERQLVLFAEDDPDIRAITRDFLIEKGLHVVCAADGQDAANWLDKKRFDLFILDIMLPGLSGFELAEKIRKSKNTTPIIFLTALNSLENKLTAFDLHADDYLTKPFELKELYARIQSVLRRTDLLRLSEENSVVKLFDFELDKQTDILSYPNGLIQLKPIESKLLQLFFSKVNSVFPKQFLMEQIWKSTSPAAVKNLDVQIHHLRKKLAPFSSIELTTIRGIGYRLDSSYP